MPFSNFLKTASYFFLLFFISFASYAQIQKPTTWTYTIKPAKDLKVGDEIEIIFSAKIDAGWKMYSAEMDPNIGPIILEFGFKNLKDIQLVGKPKPTKAAKKMREEDWDADVLVYSGSASYIQKAKITGQGPSLLASLSYQTCQEDGVCIPGSEDFQIKLSAEASSKTIEKEETLIKDTVGNSKLIETQEIITDTLVEAAKEESLANENSIQENVTVSTNQTENETDDSLWKFLLIAFGAGFASIFMPCIYPIMPMTVSYFTKQKDGKFKAIFYGISIMLIFAIMGLITMALGASFLNALSTHWIPNLIFFLIFIIFGFSLLGAFEIVLPHETVNKIDRLGDRGGLIGVFFMALTLVVVSFSCTVPFVGSLLIGAAGGQVAKPLYGMLAFGLPFALVFGGLAMFPQYLKSLPKSGGWLNELKVVFGFLEFALALKFLSNIDLAYHWNLIHRNIFLVVWILIAVITGLYILGYIRLPKDEKVENRSFLRIAFGILFFAFAAYMLPGVTNKPLNLLSGILPPLPVSTSSVSEAPKPDKMRAIPHGLWGFYEIEDALEFSKEVGKPVLIDFTGYACANCRKMEENVWSQPEVLKSLKEDFVIASLYVDDKKELPKERQYISTYDNKLKTTVGEKNLDFQIRKYNSNAQPYYLIVDSKGEKLIEPVAYTTLEKFKQFLENGKGSFKK